MKIKLFKLLSICIILSVFSIATYAFTSNNNSSSSIHSTTYLSIFKPAGDPPW
ncbi:hypothetical protein [Clostridium beijerinckii]|uniref:Uncharacterized protein n=1 Tax=Clostridium beijerinckii TaxID=1520 RepID=A0A9Q5CSH1_CLOBE|nr:hypothetical protein [Clostridium beijerinckii]AQS06674.1 hypothetical protein CLBIJ_41210 [Clostridium beijerinckii]MBA2887812.1 hypothetical protein [Clostridium beijerinckii]MBA2901674.1 hypothetical protein [Clostridium beijerinckii]MBA2911439.1 hypothetical protein [Clostridium beijerinckii]MBA9013698.1 hypothetical protein [Clostridium beijerinckii]